MKDLWSIIEKAVDKLEKEWSKQMIEQHDDEEQDMGEWKQRIEAGYLWEVILKW